jgi:hypothetical protein
MSAKEQRFLHFCSGVDAVYSAQGQITQKRSQVRVLFRPLFDSQRWGFLFCVGRCGGSF